MTKKKKTNDPFKGIADMLSRFSPEELESTIEKMKNMLLVPGEYENEMNRKFFIDNRKDYVLMRKPMCDALVPLFQAQDPRDVLHALHEVLPAMDGMTPEQRGDEVRNCLLHVLSDASIYLDKEKTCFSLYGFFSLIEKYEITAADDLLIELLRQDMHFYAYYFSCYDDVVALVYSKLFRRSAVDFFSYLLEEGRIPEMKWALLDAIAHCADTHPEERLGAVSVFTKPLGRWIDKGEYEVSVERLVYNLCHFQAKEALPLIKRAYECLDMPGLLIDRGLKGVNNLMAYGCVPIEEIEDKNVEEFLEKIVAYEEEHPGKKDDFPLDEEEECPIPWLISTEGVKDYRLAVTLTDSPIPVTRELTVPSTIELTVFERVLAMAMGWSFSHLSSFQKGKTSYIREEYMDEDSAMMYEPIDNLPLSTLLSRKGASIKWEYDFGDGWLHEIKVLSVVPHADDVYTVTLHKAENACPPEDCGGVYGYKYLLKVLADKKHPEHREMKQWVGKKFNPRRFDLEEAQADIDSYLEDMGEEWDFDDFWNDEEED